MAGKGIQTSLPPSLRTGLDYCRTVIVLQLQRSTAGLSPMHWKLALLAFCLLSGRLWLHVALTPTRTDTSGQHQELTFLRTGKCRNSVQGARLLRTIILLRKQLDSPSRSTVGRKTRDSLSLHRPGLNLVKSLYR